MERDSSRYYLVNQLKEAIIDVPDFPKKGIIFKDLTPVFLNVSLFRSVLKYLESVVPKDTNKLLAIDARGFIVASPIAVNLKLGLAIARKAGKLPGELVSVSYELEYGTSELSITKHSLIKGDRVFIVDDLLATGGTAKAAAKLCEKVGALVTGYGFIVELDFLNGRKALEHDTICSIIHY